MILCNISENRQASEKVGSWLHVQERSGTSLTALAQVRARDLHVARAVSRLCHSQPRHRPTNLRARAQLRKECLLHVSTSSNCIAAFQRRTLPDHVMPAIQQADYV